MNNESLNDRYRHGGEMSEQERQPWDTVGFFNRAARDPRVVGNQLRSMRVQAEDAYFSEEEN